MDQCSGCGAELAAVAVERDRLPCSRCGASGRVLTAVASLGGGISMSGTVSAVVITYPERLMSLAQDLAAHEEHPGIAVVVAAIACELAVERRFGRLMRERGIDADLATAIDAFLNGHNLGNDRIRSLYAALSKDDMTKQPFWGDFKNAASLRNRLVHGNAQPTPEEIGTAITAQAALVEYLKSAGY